MTKEQNLRLRDFAVVRLMPARVHVIGERKKEKVCETIDILLFDRISVLFAFLGPAQEPPQLVLRP